ncbi:hypothetical protein CWC16_19665, partial [Pseudoalteromonas sp. S3776]
GPGIPVTGQCGIGAQDINITVHRDTQGATVLRPLALDFQGVVVGNEIAGQRAGVVGDAADGDIRQGTAIGAGFIVGCRGINHHILVRFAAITGGIGHLGVDRVGAIGQGRTGQI